MAELGSGFNIATKDLEIRGAGTLLGTRQSGHISAVGFNLYTQLLSGAVDEQKGRLTAVHNDIVTRIPETVVDLPLSMMIRMPTLLTIACELISIIV
jgi:transcription-repair coupling factor (superfamily II helicase)